MATMAAVDLGAQSGRVAVGTFDGETLTARRGAPVRERARATRAGRCAGTCIDLYRDVARRAARRCARRDRRLGRGRLVGRRLRARRRRRPAARRTRSTTATPPRRARSTRVLERVPARELYDAHRDPAAADQHDLRARRDGRRERSGARRAPTAAADPRPLPLLALRQPSTEFTNATTTQCFDAAQGGWAHDLLEPARHPGATSFRRSSRRHRARCRSRPPRRATGLGDATRRRSGDARHGLGGRGRAVRGSPARSSSASARGRSSASRLDEPLITDETFAANLTNEGGVAGTYRAASERHRALAAARVPPGVGAPRAASYTFERARRARRDGAAASVAHRPERRRSSRSRATCRRAIARRTARRPARPRPPSAGETVALHPREPRAEARRDGRHARARVTGVEPERAARRRRRRAQRPALPLDRATRRGCRCWPGRRRRRWSATCSSRRWRSARSARSTRRARSSARSFAPAIYEPRCDAGLGRGARAVRRGRRASAEVAAYE